MSVKSSRGVPRSRAATGRPKQGVLTPRERCIAALERRPLTGRVPHLELVFYLTMEAFGRVHPSHRNYDQWLQMEEKERDLHRRDRRISTSRRPSATNT